VTDETIGTLAAIRPFSFPVVRCAALTPGSDGPLAGIVGDRPALLLVSGSVQRHYGAQIDQLAADPALNVQAVLPVPTGERHKTLTTVEAILHRASERRFPRRGVVVAVGGGILLDTAALAASLYKRGVSVIKVGTTLLAQVDAAIGIKCGVNTRDGKNLAGAFSPPEAVLTDGTLLQTLPIRQVRCGLAEMIKLAVVADATLFELLQRHAGAFLAGPRDNGSARRLIDRAITGMLEQLQPNAYEHDLQRAVDFGHTVSPSLEAATDYRIHHGEAVALDCALFTAAAHLLGVLQRAELDQVVGLLDELGLDRWHPILEDEQFLDRALTAAEAHRGMALNAPLPAGLGTLRFLADRADLPLDLLVEAARLLRGSA
jgi:3-dehydroquinate synthase